MDIITGNKFKEFCKYSYEPGGSFLGKQQNNSKIETVYCKTDHLRQFMQDIRNYSNDVILVSHNSDGCILPYQYREFDFHFEEHRIPGNIIKWYAQNMDVLSDRIRPVPIGLENYEWHKGTKWAEIEEINKIPIKKDKWLYLNIEIPTNPVARNLCINSLKNKGFVTHARRAPHLQYLTEMKQHKFVACPEGNGWDCHRTWEALYMGCIPIVWKRIFTQMFQRRVPMLLITDWGEVSLEMLKEHWEYFNSGKYICNKKALEFSFWKEVIKGKVKIQ